MNHDLWPFLSQLIYQNVLQYGLRLRMQQIELIPNNQVWNVFAHFITKTLFLNKDNLNT